MPERSDDIEGRRTFLAQSAVAMGSLSGVSAVSSVSHDPIAFSNAAQQALLNCNLDQCVEYCNRMKKLPLSQALEFIHMNINTWPHLAAPMEEAMRVTGIVSTFWDGGGKNSKAWRDVREASRSPETIRAYHERPTRQLGEQRFVIRKMMDAVVRSKEGGENEEAL